MSLNIDKTRYVDAIASTVESLRMLDGDYRTLANSLVHKSFGGYFSHGYFSMEPPTEIKATLLKENASDFVQLFIPALNELRKCAYSLGTELRVLESNYELTLDGYESFMKEMFEDVTKKVGDINDVYMTFMSNMMFDEKNNHN